jgi:hypothetical protein
VDKARNAEATGILKAADYCLFRFDQGRLVPEPATTWNTVAIPAEQVTEFVPGARLSRVALP